MSVRLSVLGASEQYSKRKEGTDAKCFYTTTGRTKKIHRVLQLIGNRDCVATSWLVKENSGPKARMSRDPVKTTAPLRIRLSLIL